jgi:neutral ceramidase
MLKRLLTVACLFGITCFAPAALRAADWQAGAARVNITPKRMMWMSGYGGRDKPAEGKLTDLWAKALVLQDPQGGRVALVTLDLVGIPRELSLSVCDLLKQKQGLERKQIALCTSHTHCGPVVGSNLGAMYFYDDAQRQLVEDYELELRDNIVAVVENAVKELAPARIAWGTGHSTFAVNRRNNSEPKVPELREQGLLKGPVDYDVPVLAVRHPETGKLRAVVFGYACHATVMGFYQWSGDYPGFAQIELEKMHPDAVALFFAGCGADQNPLPRREEHHAPQYEGNLTSAYQEIPLAFDTLPTREKLVEESKDSNRYAAGRAKLLLKQIDGGKPLAPDYPYPIQFWKLGTDLQFVILGGEVVVDYSIRLKNELGRPHTWVAGYSNDVMAYIPSLRVLKEGGYEGGGSMTIYGLPTIWSTQVEEQVISGVHHLRGTPRAGK